MALTVPTTASITTYNYSRGDQFDTLIVNDTKFVIFQKPLQANQSQNLTITFGCHCVFLAPMEAEHNITINAVNILALGSFSAKTGATRIHAKNFYGVGVECKDTVFVKTDEDIVIAGLHGRGDEIHLDGRNVYSHCGLTAQIREIATEIKTLFSQGMDETNGLQFAKAFFMAAQILNDSNKDKKFTPESLQPLLLKDI